MYSFNELNKNEFLLVSGGDISASNGTSYVHSGKNLICGQMVSGKASIYCDGRGPMKVSAGEYFGCSYMEYKTAMTVIADTDCVYKIVDCRDAVPSSSSAVCFSAAIFVAGAMLLS